VKLQPTPFKKSENTLYSGNENSELKNNTFQKSRSGRDYCILDIKIWKQKLRIPF